MWAGSGSIYAGPLAKISSIIVGSNRERIRNGDEILNDLDIFIKELQKLECSVTHSRNVVTQNFLTCHETQKKHFRNCLTPPEAWDPVIFDRFGHSILKRGSGKNENGWRQKRAVFPEQCGFSFAHCLETGFIAKWSLFTNFGRLDNPDTVHCPARIVLPEQS